MGKVKGIVREDGTTSTRTAARQNRRSKVFDRDAMKAEHQCIDREEFGGQAHGVVREAYAQTHEMSALLWDDRASKARAKEAVTYAIEKASEREAVGDPRALMIDALTRHLGETTLEDVTAEMERRHEQGELVGILQTDAARRQVTTEKGLKMESANVEMMRAGQNTKQPIADKSLPARLPTSQGVTLDESQHRLVEQVCTNRDRIQGVQGIAGGVKTNVLTAITNEAEKAGYKVEGFSPTTRATRKLSESGIDSKTLAKFVRQRQDPDAGKRLLVLDESWLASTRQLNAFLQKAQPQDRILLIGDTRQHEGVEAGSPFAQMQAHGMATAKLEKIVRQKDEPLRRKVEKLAIGEVKAAFDDQQQQGRITEVPDAQERLKAIAHDYAGKPEGALVISSANEECEELNRLIHDERRASGKIDATEHTTRILKNRTELTGAERTFAGAYNIGDIIRYSNRSKNFGVEAGEYARVEAVNRKGNMLTVAFAGDAKESRGERRMTYDPKRLSGVSVYREAEIKVSEGERIQVRAPMPKQRIANGELGTIEKIDAGNKWTVILDSGRKVSFPVSQNPHVDYGYAVTSHSLQGQTVERVIVNMDTRESDKLLNQRMGYVAASRMRSDVRIYTDSTLELSAALSRQVNKSTALEATQRLPPLTPQEGTTHDEQRSLTTPTGGNQTAESREAATRTKAERIFSGFDRSRLRRSAERAERNAGGDARDSGSLDRGSLEGGARTTAGESNERQNGAGRANQEFTGRSVANEREGNRELTNTGRVQTGCGQDDSPLGRRGGERQIGTEPTRVAGSTGREERHAGGETDKDRKYFTSTARTRNEEIKRNANINAPASSDNTREAGTANELHRDLSPANAQPAEQETRGVRVSAVGDGRVHRSGFDGNQNRGGDFRGGGGTDVSIRSVDVGDGQSRDGNNHILDVHRDADSSSDIRRDDGIETRSRLHNSSRTSLDSSANGWLRQGGFTHEDGGGGVGRVGTLDESRATQSLLNAARAITSRPDEYERMAGDLVRLANEFRIAATGQEISQPVQDFMHDNLLMSAQQPPTEQQSERVLQISQQLGHAETQHETALESSLYLAQFAPNRSSLLNAITTKIETTFAQQQPQSLIPEEPEQSEDFSPRSQGLEM